MGSVRRGAWTWAGKRVLITGGSSGIGKDVAALLLRRGAHVGIVADEPNKLQAAEADLKQITGEVWSYPCDVAELEDVRRMAQAYQTTHGAPDVLVNNAGYAVYYTFEQMAPEEIHRLFAVNLVGAALVTRAFLPGMIQAGGGHVVMMASIAGRIPMTPCGVYSAAKHGMVALAETLRVETVRSNVRIHVICPGRVETDFFSHESFQRRAQRPETERTVSLDAVSRSVLDSVERDRSLIHVPAYYAAMVWLSSALPFIFRPLWRRLLQARVDAVSRSTRSADDGR